MQKSQDFYEKSWKEKGWDDMVHYSPVGRHINRWILKLIGKLDDAPKSIADVGCGNGKLLQYVNQFYPKAQYYGSDLTLNSILKCKDLFPEGKFYQQNLNVVANPFPEIVDLSICTEVIEHVENDHNALLNMAKFSRYLIITVPSGPVDQMSKDMGHLRHYSEEALIEKLDKAGFKTLYSKVWGGPFAYPLYSTLRDKAGSGYVTGQYSPFKKALTHILYCSFFLNDFFNFGNKVFVLCKNKNL